MICYRLYMEDCGSECQRWVMQWWQYQPHTLYFGSGSWMGKLEESLVLETVIDEDLSEKITNFSREYCLRYKQDAVFVTKHEVTGEVYSV